MGSLLSTVPSPYFKAFNPLRSLKLKTKCWPGVRLFSWPWPCWQPPPPPCTSHTSTRFHSTLSPSSTLTPSPCSPSAPSTPSLSFNGLASWHVADSIQSRHKVRNIFVSNPRFFFLCHENLSH